MTELSALWLPIVLSAVFVFVVSSILHMATPWHRNDFPALPDEAAFRAAVGPLGIPPGDYLVPRAASPAEMRSPEFAERLSQGPVVLLTVMPNGPWTMGSNLVMWFLYSLVVSLFAGYVASRALPPGAEYMAVFRFAATTAFLGYSAALWQMSIWWKRAWSLTAKSTVDGLLYALVTAGAFGWLWPA
jgi:hypothetical protein